MARPLLLALLIALSLATPARAQESPHRDYEHDRFVTQPTEAVREFQAFKVSFDTDEDGVALGVPDWVAYELRRDPSPGGRPLSSWV